MKKNIGTLVGLFFVLGIVVLLLIFEMIGGRGGIGRGYTLHAFFQNAREIKVGSPVKMGGVEIGKVIAITLDPAKEGKPVRLDLKIRQDVPVRTDAEASILLSNLFGGNFIDVTFGTPTSPELRDGGNLDARDRTDLNTMIEQMDEVAKDVRSLTKQLAESNPLGPLTEFLTDAKPKFLSLLENVDKISDKIVKGEGTIGKLVNDPGLYDEASKTLTDVQKATDDLDTIGENIKAITTDLREGKGTVGKFLKEEEFYNEANASIKNLKEILEKINQGKGTIGELVNDPALVRNVKVSLQKLDKATDAIEDQGPLTVISILAGALF